MRTTLVIGLDVHKDSILISIAEEVWVAPIRLLGTIPNLPEEIGKPARKLS